MRGERTRNGSHLLYFSAFSEAKVREDPPVGDQRLEPGTMYQRWLVRLSGLQLTLFSRDGYMTATGRPQDGRRTAAGQALGTPLLTCTFCHSMYHNSTE